MHKIQTLIAEHYDSVKTKVDISVETLILTKVDQVDNLNSLKKTLIDKINEIYQLNLKNIESIEYTTDNLEDYKLGKFCFFIEKVNHKFEITHLGMLLITNVFVSRNIREALKKELNNVANDLSVLTSKSVVAGLAGFVLLL
ncbi:unnamed protein product [Brachionus calyciflorus]|uniref:Uncharacterized protein n=1 Tax=Brachionus calyciflorus TaxID=104777 RepID=A0A814NS01_9BILA|nr:unnamed protein product [Brachionus calyciflorus]